MAAPKKLIGNISPITNPRETVNKKIVEMDQYPIADLQNLIEENLIINLREEKIKEWKRKEEEVKNKQIAEKEKEIVRQDITKKIKKEVDGKKYTFDVNGNPVTIKNVIVEKLADDFGKPR
jgi:hypothetical protein